MSKKERESGRKWDGRSRISNDKYKKNWEEIYGQREQEELNESMKEAFRQRDERKKKEQNKRYNGSVNFQEEGDFIFCTRCKDNTIHQPTFGKCMKCGLEEYNEKQ